MVHNRYINIGLEALSLIYNKNKLKKYYEYSLVYLLNGNWQHVAVFWLSADDA